MARSDKTHEFVDTNPEIMVETLTALYEDITGMPVLPASPISLFIAWIADAVVQIMAMINHAANQNIPSRAVGKNLDALGELYFDKARPQAKPATVTMRFVISEAQESAVLIPKGTRVAVKSGEVQFATEADMYVEIGTTTATVSAVCLQNGEIANGYLPGQITDIIDPFPYYASCSNITTSDGGADAATDEEYYMLLIESQDAYSTAGAIGAYEYWAKSVNVNIEDVRVTSPNPGEVKLYVLMNDGTKASEEIKTAVQAACSADKVRPLTDHVEVVDPTEILYNINLVYYLKKDSANSAAEIEAGVEAAINNYVIWQSAKLGRDINPSALISEIMKVDGVKRVEVTEPSFTVVADGSGGTTPSVAKAQTITANNGGYEDD